MSRTIQPPSGDAVLVTWLAKSSDPYVRQRPTFHQYVVKDGKKMEGPLLEALAHPASPLRGRLSEVYLCWRDTEETSDEISEGEVLKQTLHEWKALGLNKPKISGQRWKTDARPIDHDAIKRFAEGVLRRVRREHPDAHIYIHSSPGTTAMSNVWVILGATGFIPGKVTLLQGIPERFRAPHDSPLISVSLEVESWLKRFRRSRPRSFAPEDDGQLIERTEIKSPALEEALAKLERWAPLRVPLLLVGERGTGKTTMANYVRGIGPFQRLGAKADWPVAVCGQFRVDVNMARSELFGHEKGAFTGADAPRKGLLEQADGDCLFLDEIGDIDKSTQRLLVAALEGRGFRRLGGEATQRSRFRLLCATNRPLDDMLLSGELDRDFFDRIRYAVIEIPPLRRCQEDIPWFWRKVLRRAAHEAELDIAQLGELERERTLLAAFNDHELPGNLRDLYRVAFHLFASLQSGASLGDSVQEALTTLDEPMPLVTPEDGLLPSREDLVGYLPLERELSWILVEYRNRWIEAAMLKANDVVAKAAELVRIKRRTFAGWVDEVEKERRAGK